MIQTAKIEQLEMIVRFFDENQHNISQNGFVSSAVIDRQIKLGVVDLYFIDGSLTGVAIYSKNFKRLFNLLIKKNMRKKGIGKFLLSHRNPDFVRCKTNMKSGNSQGFYEKQGYKPLSEVKKGIILMSKNQRSIDAYVSDSEQLSNTKSYRKFRKPRDA